MEQLPDFFFAELNREINNGISCNRSKWSRDDNKKSTQKTNDETNGKR